MWGKYVTGLSFKAGWLCPHGDNNGVGGVALDHWADGGRLDDGLRFY